MVTRMGSGTASRVIGAIACLGVAACSSVGVRPRLTEQRVIRIAETQARRDLDYDLREYRIKSVHYLHDDNRWHVIYRHWRVSSTWFAVEVDDTTKKAVVSMP